MTVLVQFSGPSYSKTAVLRPGEAPIDVGRDAQAGIHLPDQERLISRRHITIEWAEGGGVKVVVLSKLNGVSTPKGDFSEGQQVILSPGESARLGRFTMQVQQDHGATRPIAVAQQARGPGSGRPATAAPVAPTRIEGSTLDPMAAFGPSQAPKQQASSIDDFLSSTPRTGTGLGASQILRVEPPKPPSRPAAAQAQVPAPHVPMRPLPMPPVPAAAAPAQPKKESVEALDLLLATGSVSVRAAPEPPTVSPIQQPRPSAPAPAATNDDWDLLVKLSGASAHQAPAPNVPAAGPEAVGTATFAASAAWRYDELRPGEGPVPVAGDEINEELLRAAFAVPDPMTATGSVQSPAQADAMRFICEGLGITAPGQMSPQNWIDFGASVRQIVEALSDLMNARAELKREMRASDRTMLGGEENNPLKTGMAIDELLHYLLFMRQGSGGYMPPRRALDESVVELRAHEFASVAAVRAAVEGSIREFEPEKLRTNLLKGKSSLLSVMENARLWDLYVAHYEKKGAQMADWLEQLFNRYFMPAYTREAERLKRQAREASSGNRG